MRIKYKTRKTITQVLSILLLCALGLGAIFGVSALSNKLKEDTKVIHPTFEVGGLANNGEYLDTDASIYTKESFECKGLAVKLDFDSAVKYKVYYYDNFDNFLETSEEYNKGMELVVPESAYYARLVVTPIWNADVETENKVCHWYDVSKYARQLEISVLKNQPEYGAPKESEVLYDGAKLFDFASGNKAVPTAASFQYVDSSAMHGRTVTKIGVPVHSVADNTKDCVFTVSVVEGSGATATYVEKYEFTIKANTYSSTTVNEWVYFNCNIELGEDESLAFMNSTDTVYFSFGNFAEFANQSGFYTHVLNGTAVKQDGASDLVFDIWVEKE